MRQLQFASILVAAMIGLAGEERTATAAHEAPVSLGYPNSGRLVGGVRFHETSYMTMVAAHATSKVRWAMPELLSVLDRAARIVARKYPGSVLELGELSRHDGGPIASHRSHQNGRDADVGFYQIDLNGDPVRAPRFVRFDGAGDCLDDPTERFDDRRNWALVRAMLEDPRYEVRQIFVYAPLRARLLAYAAKVGAPRDLRTRAAQAMMQPGNALPHDDHFHIRISCPADQIDLGCTDLPLWHAPGSPDDFGPDLLAESPRAPLIGDAQPALPRYAWGPVSKLWSSELGLCNKVDMACTDDEGAACAITADLEEALTALWLEDAEASSRREATPVATAPAAIALGPDPGASQPNEPTLALPSDGASASAPSCDFMDAAGVERLSHLLYSSLEEGPNACDLAATALVGTRSSETPGDDPSVLE